VYNFSVSNLTLMCCAQVMRALGLGVVVEAGPGSQFKIGDNVSGAWGEFKLPCPIGLSEDMDNV